MTTEKKDEIGFETDEERGRRNVEEIVPTLHEVAMLRMMRLHASELVRLWSTLSPRYIAAFPVLFDRTVRVNIEVGNLSMLVEMDLKKRQG